MKKAAVFVLGLVFLAAGCGDDPRFFGDDRMSGGTGGGSSGQCGGASDETTPLDAEEQRFLALLNQYRANNGAPPVLACTSLNRAAQRHSEDMRDQNYFDHTGLDGSSPGDRACDACFESCTSGGFGENIAAGNADAEATFEQWRTSPGHNSNMLREGYVVVGIGRATGGGTYRAYWTNVFSTTTDPSCN